MADNILDKDGEALGLLDDQSLPPRGSPDGSSELIPDLPLGSLSAFSSHQTTNSGDTTSTLVEDLKDNDTDNPTGPSSWTEVGVLPWGVPKERIPFPPTVDVATDLKPGEFVMRTLFAQFTEMAERKIENCLIDHQERPHLSKILQRGEDPQFDQLLSAFGCVAEHCLPSLLRTLFAWFQRQSAGDPRPRDLTKGKGEPIEKSELEVLQERRALAVHFIFCLVLVEVLKQLPFHPGHEDLLGFVETLAFSHFKYRDTVQLGLNASNVHMISDLYAEVLGVLVQSRFQSVRKRFMQELRELSAKEPSPVTTQSIIALLMGMKFFRVKMVPIEEFEASFQFLQECAQYFLDCKDKDVKHAMAGLFVEIIIPVAANVKNEVNVPCLKNFVELLYSQTLDLSTKNKHRLALFPLVTCLLCVSQKTFFLNNWHYFLAMCLSNLKNKDTKMSRVALESLYRLLWVYMIRIRCESNSATQSRLQSIVNSLFPKGSKAVMPRDTPLNIFVKIIQFIAQERLDFAMREIVFDLLSVGRPVKIILTPERMSIGLRAFLVVADSLQQKEGLPPMPRTVAVLPSGNTLRIKKTFLSKMLTEDTARSIGISSYYVYVRKTFDDILKALDMQFGRPLMMTQMQNSNKEPDDLLTGERKPKIDLFRTCVAAVPRLIPDGMSRTELVELLSRLTVHFDEELRGLACQSLQNLILDFPDWREDVVHGYVQFIVREVPDTCPHLLDITLRVLVQLLSCWRNTQSPVIPTVNNAGKGRGNEQWLDVWVSVLHRAEALALVMLCHCRLAPRRLAVHILKEVRVLLRNIGSGKGDDPMVDVMDVACNQVIERCLPLLPSSERSALTAASTVDLQWLAERSSAAWTAGLHEDGVKSSSLQSLGPGDPWGTFLFGLVERDHILQKCPTACLHAWPTVHARVTALFSVIDPTPVSENRASLLRSATTIRRPVSERDVYLHLWKNYVALAFRLVPPTPNPVARCASPDLVIIASPEGSVEKSELKLSSSPSSFYKLVVPLLKSELEEVRNTVVMGMGMVNPKAFKDVLEELQSYVREAVDRKQENMRRRKRRDGLRLQLVRVVELVADSGTFGVSPLLLDRDSQSLHPTLVELVEGVRQCLEPESEKEAARDIKIHFCSFLRKMIRSFTLESRQNLLKRDLRRNLFYLFATWSGGYGRPFGFSDRRKEGLTAKDEPLGDLELAALQAMSSVLCCGGCFDPQVLAEDGCIYNWLDMLVASTDEKVHSLSLETVVLLLELNPDLSALLDWVVDRCYTADSHVADTCFQAIATIFATREYPCDHYTAIINVALLNTGCPREHISETALQLLQILDNRFFVSVSPLIPEGDGGEKGKFTLDRILQSCYSRSQTFLSRQLAELHPELTMPMFSEITFRLQTARPYVRQLLLQSLLPWLQNMELVDPNLPLIERENSRSGEVGDGVGVRGAAGTREGWGSVEATEMVLNNLFYATAKFGDEASGDLEALWSALASCWPPNLKALLRYLLIVAGMAPNELLSHAKRVVVWVGRSVPERLLDELTGELQAVETLSWLIERTETPPFFRLTSLRKASTHSDQQTQPTQAQGLPSSQFVAVQPEGTIHTKRHSGDDNNICKAPPLRSSSNPGAFVPVPSQSQIEKGRTVSGPAVMPDPDLIPELLNTESEVDSGTILCEEDTLNVPVCGSTLHIPTCGAGGVTLDSSDFSQPHPLPMPEYGGFFAPLTEFLPDSSQPVSGFHRCNLAVMLLCDLVVDGSSWDWNAPLPLLLHIVFLGMDHSRSLVHEHCKKMLMHLLLVLSCHGDHLALARILLHHKAQMLGFGLTLTTLPVLVHCFTEPNADLDTFLQIQKGIPTVTAPIASKAAIEISIPVPPSSEPADKNVPTVTVPIIIAPGDGTDGAIVPKHGADLTLPDIVKSIIDFLAARPNQPLWNCEDITARVWNVKSADQLGNFVCHVVHLLGTTMPNAHLEERWAQVALQLGLSCSSRHYAGRSLQVFRALGAPLSMRALSDLLSRLVETVTEHGEDMQGYVTELILTLEAAVEALESELRPLDLSRDLFKSTPNLNHKDGSRRGHGPPIITQGSPTPGSPGHARSTSCSIGIFSRPRVATGGSSSAGGAGAPSPSPSGGGTESRAGGPESRARSRTESEAFGLVRSRSAQSLRLMDCVASQEDKLSLLSTIFWVGVALLHSDYEHEFLLALRLLERLLPRLPLDRPDCRDRLERLQTQLRWPSFPGLHSLLLKGLTNANTHDATVRMLSLITPLLDTSVIDPSQGGAFPLHVTALLPYMVFHYDDDCCLHTAGLIAQACTEKSHRLDNLATIMTLYHRRTFSKESFQWTKCVVKYLHDAYADISLTLINLLVEVLEKGPSILQPACLSTLHCMLHYVDLCSSPSQALNGDLLRAIAKHLEGSNWREALKMVKLVVARSSALSLPPLGGGSYSHWDTSSLTSFPEGEGIHKKELPGRTLDFSFDVSQTPVIARRYLQVNESSPCRVARSSSLGTSESSPSWKRPWLSQAKVRECLLSVLNTCGQRVGLPKSPSVIFSQSSELLERQSSITSSTEEMSGPQLDHSHASPMDAPNEFGVFRDFDFLEYELESTEGGDSDNFNWGVRRRPLSHLDTDTDIEISVAPEPESLTDTNPSSFHKLSKPCSLVEVSSDDGSVSPLEEVPHTHTEGHGIFPSRSVSPQLQINRMRRPSQHSDTSCESSEADMGETTPCNASPIASPAPLPRHSISHSLERDAERRGEEKEEKWRQNLATLLSTPSIATLTEALATLQPLVREAHVRTVSLTQEAAQLLSSGGNCALESLTQQLHFQADLLHAKGSPPLVYAGGDNCLPLAERVRFLLLELREHLDTWTDRREALVEALDGGVRPALKLMRMGDSLPDLRGEEAAIDAVKAAYRLHFQLLLLLQACARLSREIAQGAFDLGIHDCSEEVLLLETRINSFMESQWECESESTESTPSFSLVEPDVETVLMQLLAEQKWGQVLSLIREHRPPLAESEDEVGAVMITLCQARAIIHGGAVAICPSYANLTASCEEMMGACLQLLERISTLERQEASHHNTPC